MVIEKLFIFFLDKTLDKFQNVHLNTIKVKKKKKNFSAMSIDTTYRKTVNRPFPREILIVIRSKILIVGRPVGDISPRTNCEFSARLTPDKSQWKQLLSIKFTDRLNLQTD